MPSNSSNGPDNGNEHKTAGAVRASKPESRARRLWRALHHFFERPLNGLFALAGMVIFLSAAYLAAEEFNIRTNTTEFCVSCHSMEAYVYQEYQQSKHYTNPSGARPECGECHVSRRFFPALWDHAMGTHDLISEFRYDWSRPEMFDEHRPRMAEKARLWMLRKDSHTCRECHKMEAITPTRMRGVRAHNEAIEKDRTNCIVCHYNLVHKEKPLTPAFSEAIKAYNEVH